MSVELVVELLCKSSVIAGAGLVLSAVLASRPAADRVDVLRAAVCVLLGLPLIMALLPALQLPLLPAAAAEPLTAPIPVWQATVTPVEGLSLSSSIRPPSPLEIMLGVWALGAAVVFGRFALGVMTLWRWTRSGAPVTDSAWTGPLEHFGVRRQPRLVASPQVEAPLSWGLPPGVVLIGKSCLARPENAGAVMAHELAHIRRGDWLFLALSRLALALFWFSPLVWLLHATLASRTEDAADAAALTAVDRRTYARALVGLAADFRQSAAIGMAGDAQSLTRRITRIMTSSRTARPRPKAMALAIGALVAVATPIAALEITQRPPAPPAPLQAAVPAPPAPPALPSLLAVPAPPAPPAHPAPPAPPAPPRPQDGSRIVITDEGRTRTYRSVEEMDPETRRNYEQTMREAAASRVHAAEAREQAQAARTEAARARAEARVHHAAAMEQARAATVEAHAAAAEARAHASAAREEARHAMARARIDMRNGADEMDRGAREMREEAARLRDPAYRARQIEENRARGSTVTDAELVALSRRLPEQADEMERQAQRMREQSANHT